MKITFADREVEVTFDEEGSVNVYDAVAFVTKAMVAAGAEMTQPFSPEEQYTDMGKFDNDYIRADARFDIPGLGYIWLEVECQHDGAE